MSSVAVERQVLPQARVVAALAGRGLRVQMRRAQFLVPSFMLPLVLLGIIASGTSSASKLPGFPDTGSFVGFIIGGTIVQGTLFAGLTGGIAMAADIEGGFMDRLMAAPVARVSLVLGRIAGASVVGAVQAIVFLTVAFAFGARYQGGVIGIAETIVLASVSAGACAGLASAIAIRTGSLQLMQNLFPVMFVLLFTAPAFFPREFLNGTFRAIAPFNPLTYVVEGIRAALHDNPQLGDPLHGLIAGAIFLLGSTVLAVLAMRSRVSAS